MTAQNEIQLSLRTITKELERVFDFYNQKLFANELPKVIITFLLHLRG